MYLTEKEIGLEFESIEKSVGEVVKYKDEIISAFSNKSRCWFIGCGSSFTLAKSAAAMMLLHCNLDAYAVAAGDMLLHFERYERSLKDSIVVFLSRSGSTSEVIETAKLIKKSTNALSLSVCAKTKSVLDEYCALNIHIPWAFDESVCQTRTVGSLYACTAAITALISGKEDYISKLLSIGSSEEQYKQSILEGVTKAAAADWNHVVVLADSEAAGIMEEGALAYKEICQINSNFYNVLDVRHGPMVMINEKTFVFVMVEKPGKIVNDLISDLKAKGAFCVVCCPECFSFAANVSITAPSKDIIIASLYALYYLQLVSLHKALNLGINPDAPEGLSPWIRIS